ncbi:14208_t:CDS:2 [Acaulospora colombiana]|uniref:14208_t:CDS:1 n=1 Tax=Acaulospora colombiana TaxID=27376 RepID=A0ACA9N767_9GLOM|nr:14208_t:CDS:2 [Acaulospora colombiana]
MNHLKVILDRLIDENLLSTSGSSATSQHRVLRPEVYGDFEQNDEKDPDIEEIEEPRWKDLFEEYFLDNNDNKHDDLLFFVRKDNSEDDPVFVKRKPNQRGVKDLDVNDTVLWKETFLLNLIVQLPCKLTVAVCTRSTDNSNELNPKTSMICSRKHVSKRVYALPTKSRMDIKESSMECSYPLIYYVIDDYEEMFEHLIVTQGEYLCVELAATITNKSDDDDLSDRDNESSDGYYNESGAAPYSALVDIYKQKAAGKLNRRFKMGPVTPPTEYVMMRGPSAKGHAQVAITASSLDEINDDGFLEIASPSSLTHQSWSGDGNNTIPSAQNGGASARNSQTISANSFFQSLKKISQVIAERPSADPESLKCCMTFVNVHWNDIIK